ncbi:MAG: type II secretion system protein, partial [Armatimonadota bacterium]
MRLRNDRSGFTLVEALLVLGIMGFIGAGAMALMVGSLTCFDGATTEAFTDTDAVLAMQM